GDWAAGERGLACLPGRKSEFRAAIHTALDVARAIACPRIHVLAGLGDDVACYVSNLQWAAAQAAEIELCIEPINGIDMPGYFLSRQQQALDLIEAIGAPNLRLQFDGYHCQISEGEVLPNLRRAFEHGALGHVQVAGVPGRNEPEQSADWLSELDKIGYSGHVGLEYRPRTTTRAGLGWLQRWR
ncbi:MAG TPA: TIM barrel protein, partial [Burkholderiaceae bacterium]